MTLSDEERRARNREYTRRYRERHPRPPAPPPLSPCVDHACDGCPTCLQGHCCRGDNPSYVLPAEGAWEPIFGVLGVTEETDDQMRCMACGGWYQSVGRHAWSAHDLTHAEYRALFGLGFKQSLMGARLRARYGDVLAPQWGKHNEELQANRLTPERLSMLRSQPNRRAVRLRLFKSRSERGKKNAAGWTPRFGIPPTNAKLTFERAERIRELVSEGKLTQTEIGRRFGVTQGDVSQIVRGTIWKPPDGV